MAREHRRTAPPSVRLRAVDIMHAAAESISVRATIETCLGQMDRLKVDGLAVSDQRRVVGLISRWDVDKALQHRLGGESVDIVMTAPAMTVRPGTSLARIYRLMVERRAEQVAVVDDHGLVGMVCASDLLKNWPPEQGELPEVGPGAGESHDLKASMAERFSPQTMRVLKRIGQMGRSLENEIFLVGGSVRDLFLRVPDVDLDIAVVGDGIAFARQFVARHGGRVVCYRRFATALMALPGGLKIDVVSARWEKYHRPGALPTIEPGALVHDLYRRDFTINSMAIQLSGENFGRLVDPFGGRRDLDRGIIAVMHNLSFVEDPTRMIRAVRFEGRYGFRMNPPTRHLLAVASGAHLLDRISGQRLREELLILLREKNPLPAIRRLDRLGVLSSLSHELTVTDDLARLLERIHGHLERWQTRWPEDPLDAWVTYLVGLFSQLSPGEMERLSERLCLHRKANECLRAVRRCQGEVLKSLSVSRRPANSLLYRLLHHLPSEALVYLMAATPDRSVSRRVAHYRAHLRDVRLAISGEDLKQMGLSPGAEYGRLLEAVLMAKLDGHVRDRSEELLQASRMVRRGAQQLHRR